MTIWEILRMGCYTIAAPSLLYLALWMGRQRLYAQMCFYASLSLLFIWYMVEITIAATGINTREYRVIGTPMVVSATISAVWMAMNLVRARMWRRELLS
jgi:hypothetical protein